MNDARPESRRKALALLAEALGRDRHFIARHPSTLFQCLWNSCWWYDCPNANGHYEPPDGGWGADVPPWDRQAPALHALLEQWRETREARSPAAAWIRSIRPPIIPLGVGLSSVFRGHTAIVSGIAFSGAGQLMVTSSLDGSVRLWDTQSGVPHRRIPIPDPQAMPTVIGVAVSPDARLVAFNTSSHVFVCNPATGEPIVSLKQEAARCLAFSPTGRMLAFAAGGGFSRSGLFVMDVETGAPFRFPRSPRATTSIAFPRDGRLLLTGDEDGLVGIWDVLTGAPIHTLGGLNSYGVAGVSFSADERYIAVGLTNGWVEFWEAGSGKQLGSHGVGGFISGLVVLPDNDRIVVAQHSGVFTILSRRTGVQTVVAGPGDLGVHSLAVAPGGRFVASGLGDGSVQIWHVEAAKPMPLVRLHRSDITRVTGSRDGNSLFTQDRETVIEWGWHQGFSRFRDLGDVPTGVPTAPASTSWRIVTRDGESEILNARGEVCAWFPTTFETVISNPRRRSWAASTGGRYVFLLVLEGLGA